MSTSINSTCWQIEYTVVLFYTGYLWAMSSISAAFPVTHTFMMSQFIKTCCAETSRIWDLQQSITHFTANFHLSSHGIFLSFCHRTICQESYESKLFPDLFIFIEMDCEFNHFLNCFSCPGAVPQESQKSMFTAYGLNMLSSLTWCIWIKMPQDLQVISKVKPSLSRVNVGYT